MTKVILYAIWKDQIAPVMGSISYSPSSWTSENVTITAKATDVGSGLVAYQFSTSSSLTASSTGWTSISTTTSEITKTYSVSSNDTYYFYLKDVAGNINKKSVVITNIDKTPPQELGKGKLAISRSYSLNTLSLNVSRIYDEGIGVSKIVFYYKKWSDSYFTKGEEKEYAPMYGNQPGRQDTFSENFTAYFSGDISNESLSAYVEVYDVLGNVRKSYLATVNPDGSTSYVDW